MNDSLLARLVVSAAMLIALTLWLSARTPECAHNCITDFSASRR